MESTTLDVELFISEVKKYPELWDVQNGNNRYMFLNKQKVWEKVAAAVIDNFDELPKQDKIEVYTKLSTRWRNMRDTYVRYMRKKDTDHRKTYRYAKDLDFLEKRYKESKPRPRKWRKTDEIEVEIDTPDWIEEDSAKDMDFKDLDPKEETIWPEEMLPKQSRDLSFVEINDSSIQSTSMDDDRSFFDSLLPAIRHFDLDQKLDFRSDILKLVTQYRKQGSSRRSDESE